MKAVTLQAVAIVAGLLLAGCTTLPRGAETSAAWRGRDLAARNCAGCHDVGREGVSLLRAAPPFRLLAPDGPAAIRDFAADLRRHHPDGMPQILLSQEQAGDLYAYMRSLRSQDPRDRLPAAPPCVLRAC